MSQAIAFAYTSFQYRYNPTDDLESLKWWLARAVSPSSAENGTATGNDPNMYVIPLEGTFIRPAVTVELTDTGRDLDGLRAGSHDYKELLSITVRCYGIDRQHTLDLGELVWTAINDGGADNQPYRPQMWALSLQTRLARRMSVLQTSLAMGLLQTDDEGKWSRPISMRVKTPRTRKQLPAPVIQQITETLHAN